MYKGFVSFAVLLTLAGLGGCATMNADECMTVDWRTVGYEDGMRGYTGDRIGQHRKACAKHGVTPDLTAYNQGREQGLAQYCQPSRGFDVGANGGNYQGVCSAHYEADFLDAYNAGYHLYTLRSNVSRTSSAIAARERELDRVDARIDDSEAQLIAADTTAEQRVLLLRDLKDLAEESGQLEAEIRQLLEERGRYQNELDNYRVVVADLGY